MKENFFSLLTRLSLSILLELLVIFLAYKITSNNIEPEKPVIRGDGKGYYDYLPAIFIYHDLQFGFRDSTIEDYRPEQYSGLNIPYEGRVVNKYPIGEAIVLAPAFLITHAYCLSNGLEANGFSEPYQNCVVYSALLALAIGLFFMRKLFKTYGIPFWISFLSLLLLTFGSQLYFYSFIEPSYSHVYSFAAIAIFLYLLRKYFSEKKSGTLLIAAPLLALIILLRPVNLLVLLFVPFLTTDWKTFWDCLLEIIWKKWKTLLLAAVLFFSVIFIQLLTWYLQTGYFVVWSYQKEGFDFTQPEICEVLFGFRKGLFIYTPVFLFVILIFFFTYRKKIYSLSVFSLWFAITIYVTASWHVWWYGMSYGLRPMVDFTSIFMLLMVLSIVQLTKWWRIVVLTLSLPFVYLVALQSYQYRYFILHWDEMNFEKFSKVFLKTDYRYRGLVWLDKTTHQPQNYTSVYSEKLNQKFDLVALREKDDNEYLLALEWFPKEDTLCKFVGIRYTVKGVKEDDLKILINVLDKASNSSYSYNDFYLFHHLNLDKETNELYYIMAIPDSPANSLRIIVEFNQLQQSKCDEIILEEIQFYK